MKIIEQKLVVEHTITEFNDLRTELRELLDFYSQDKREQALKWKNIDIFLKMKIE